jgi:hypothetical protein
MQRPKKRAGDAKKRLVTAFMRKRVATMDDLMAALDTQVRMSIYRLLKELSYRTSYSHAGRYYALERAIRFDEHGLWSVRSIRFSKYGTLMDTAERFVSDSARGFFASELEQLLRVSVKETMLRLVQKGRISRERISHAYLYCSADPAIRKRQLAARGAELGVPIEPLGGREDIPDNVKAAIILFTALLDERQLRLFAGVQALQFGHGAESWIADLLGIHRQTVAKGRQQLLEGNTLSDGIRRRGAGRPRIEKKTQKSSKKSKN